MAARCLLALTILGAPAPALAQRLTEDEIVRRAVETAPLDQLAEYASGAPDTTTLLLLADKLDNRRRLVATAKREGFLVVCASLPPHALPGTKFKPASFLSRQADAR